MPKTDPHLIIPFAKPAGITSFSSLGQVKRLLGTNKVGHTGTLDRFADGLLILLSGKLTKLVPAIMGLDKTYLVQFCFGKETDTLDPEGAVIAEKPLPRYGSFCDALRTVTGTIQQIPPVYSAIKQNGERLSDRVRRGETVTAAPRTVTVYDIQIDDIFYKGASSGAIQTAKEAPAADCPIGGAALRVRCSKGTYIRSLVRDIAYCCGSAAYVYALRRTAVGPFQLEDAAGSAALPPFRSTGLYSAAVDAFALNRSDDCNSRAVTSSGLTREELDRAAVPFCKTVAERMRLGIAELKQDFYTAFQTGRQIQRRWFAALQPAGEQPIAVFCGNYCMGFIAQSSGGQGYVYKTVLI